MTRNRQEPEFNWIGHESKKANSYSNYEQRSFQMSFKKSDNAAYRDDVVVNVLLECASSLSWNFLRYTPVTDLCFSWLRSQALIRVAA